MERFFRAAFLLVIILGVGYYFRAELTVIAAQLTARYAPCALPIKYAIGAFDERFDISREDFLAAIAEAEAIWEEPSGRELFEPSDSGALKINLVYDTRQETTEQLRTLGIEVSDTRASYDALKERYDSLRASHAAKRAAFDAKYASYRALEREFNRNVAYWNGRGGAPEAEYEQLQKQKANLSALSTELSTLQKGVNAYVDDINALAEALNQAAKALNLNIREYNTVGRTTGEEFEEAVYESAPGSVKIDVYEFSSYGKLVRVLAHELGHSLGLEHVSDEESIMYRINQSSAQVASEADLEELERLCGAN